MADDYQPSVPYTGPTQTPAKKGGCGCCGWGCLILGVISLTFVLLVGGGLYWVGSSLTGKETPVYEGTSDEIAALQKKLAALQQSISDHQTTTTIFSANELNIIVCDTPMGLKQHLFVTIEDNVIHCQTWIPLGQFFPILGSATTNAEFDFVPHVQDGEIHIDLKEMKIRDHPLDPSLLPNINQQLNDQIKVQIAHDAKAAEAMKHVKSLTVENNQVVITTQ